MPTPKIKHSRGDVYLGNQAGLEDGQFFYSFINQDKNTSDNHTYSEGQLWIKDPSSEDLTEIANRRSLKSLTFRGWIYKSFKGDFLNANDSTEIAFSHCHEGDFWILDYTTDSTTSFTTKFRKGDILLITKAEYTIDLNTENAFRDKLKNVEYIKIPLPNLDTDDSDLNEGDYTDTVKQLEQRLNYRGELASATDLASVDAKVGYTYVVTKRFEVLKNRFDTDKERNKARQPNELGYITLRVGDLIKYNGETWTIIPIGQAVSDIIYIPNEIAIDNVDSFSPEHKEQLKSARNVSEALDILNITKAHLGADGRIPYEELPEAVAHGLTLQGLWHPLTDIALTGEIFDANDPANQADWPIKDENFSNLFWIVDCDGKVNVQYHDKTVKNRIIEFNTGDFIVFSTETKRFEVVDNSDRLTSITVTIPTVAGKKQTLLGDVGITADNKIKLKIDGNQIIIGGDRLISQSLLSDGEQGYFPIYSGDGTEFACSTLYQDLETNTIYSKLGFQIGTLNDPSDIIDYGNIGIRKTRGATKTTFTNNFFFIDSASTLKYNNGVFYRTTRIRPSERNTFATADEEIDIFFPEASSTMLGVFLNDSLTRNYLSKANYDGFVTDSLTSEQFVNAADASYERDGFKENFEQGFSNVGIGRSTAEDSETGEITFYAKSKDRLGSRGGFYVQLHSILNLKSQGADKVEHLLRREKTSRTHLIINPTVLEDDIETFVNMPTCSGTLLTWEELLAMFSRGVPLMLPAWELMNFRFRKGLIGLDTSPVTIKINRPAHDNVEIDRVNDLGENYGAGDKSTWSYIDSSKKGSLQDDTRGRIDDVVSFDSWLEAQRSIATKEAFIIPSTAKKDGNAVVDPETLDYIKDPEETKNDTYGKNKAGGKYQRLLPSRTLYEDEPVYFDPVTGKELPQNTRLKDVEMPAVGGVLLTSRSRIEGGVWL